MLMLQGIVDAKMHFGSLDILFYLVKPALARFARQSCQSSRFGVAQSIPTVSIFNHWGSFDRCRT
jgi:hypothetical protein